MLSNKERLSEDARIKVSTIHAAKGGECENVILVLDNAKKIREAVTKSIIDRDWETLILYKFCHQLVHYQNIQTILNLF